jgi:hypothetical protein
MLQPVAHQPRGDPRYQPPGALHRGIDWRFLDAQGMVAAGVSMGAIGIALAIGGFLPHFERAGLHRLETQTIPQLQRRIHDAEMTYSASQPDRAFACDGRMPPGPAWRLKWSSAIPSSNTTYFIWNV